MKLNNYRKDNQRWRSSKKFCGPVSVLFIIIIVSLLCSGCSTTRAITTLKLGRDKTLARGDVKFRIESIDWTVEEKIKKPTVENLNAIAVKAYPALFSDRIGAWPVKIAVKGRGQLDYDHTLWTILTGFVVPFPAQKSTQYDVDVVVYGVAPASVPFTIEETVWTAWPPLGLIPPPGPSHARGHSMYFDTEPIDRLTHDSVVEAVAQELKKLDASVSFSNPKTLKKLAEGHSDYAVRQYAADVLLGLTIDEKLIERAYQKAKEIGCNPILVYANGDGEIFVLEGTSLDVQNKELNINENDMVINVGKNPCSIGDEVVNKSDYMILRDGRVYTESVGWDPGR